MAKDMQKALLMGLSALALASCNTFSPAPVGDSPDALVPDTSVALWPAVERDLIDAAIEARIAKLMANMTLEQ